MLMEHTLGTTVAERVRRLRRERGMTATQLAGLAGVSEDAIRKIEAGRSKAPSFVTGLRIAEALEVAPATIAFGSSTPSKAPRGEAPQLATVLRLIRERRKELEAVGVAHASVFGSVARGSATAESDVDVLIQRDARRRFSLIALSQVGLLLEDRLGRAVDVLTEGSLSADTAQRVQKEAVIAF